MLLRAEKLPTRNHQSTVFQHASRPPGQTATPTNAFLVFFFPMPVFVTKVGPEGISADTIPYWMVQLLVLGQPAGYVCIPNRNLEETAVSPAGSATGVGIKQATEVGEGEPGAPEEAAADEDDELRTLGDLRALISWQLDLAIRGVELWIAPPETCSSGTFPSTRGDGNVQGDTDSEISLPETPRGDKALLDNMDLGHYGLHHLSVVDVRLSPEFLETGCGGSEATQPEGGISGEVSEKDGESSEKQGETSEQDGESSKKDGDNSEKDRENSEADGENNENDRERNEKDGKSSEEEEEWTPDEIVRISVKTTRMMARGEDGAVSVFLLCVCVIVKVGYCVIAATLRRTRFSAATTPCPQNSTNCNGR